jgi:hypothetical protein
VGVVSEDGGDSECSEDTSDAGGESDASVIAGVVGGAGGEGDASTPGSATEQ